MSSGLPFRHVLNVRTLPRKGRSERHELESSALPGLAEHLDVRALSEVVLMAEVLPWKRDGVRVEGHVAATVTQDCVVTLEPVVSRLDEAFETLLVPEGSRLAAAGAMGELVLDAEGDDPPETFEGDSIDLAEIWTEFLALAIDPFPRAPGAELPDAAKSERPSAFAALAALKAANDE